MVYEELEAGNLLQLTKHWHRGASSARKCLCGLANVSCWATISLLCFSFSGGAVSLSRGNMGSAEG